MKRVVFLLLSGAVVLADLLSKSAVFSWHEAEGLLPGQIRWISGDWFGLTRAWNPGVTGGMGAWIPPFLLTAFTFLAVLGIALYLLLPKVQSRWVTVGLALILGGAIGNLYDRAVFGMVRDFLDVWPRLPWPSWLHHWPTFNLADSAIVTGVSALVFHSLFLAKGETAKDEVAPAADGAD